MVGVAGKSGGRRPGAGRRPGSKSIKKDVRKGKKKAKVVTVPDEQQEGYGVLHGDASGKCLRHALGLYTFISCRLSAHLHMFPTFC